MRPQPFHTHAANASRSLPSETKVRTRVRSSSEELVSERSKVACRHISLAVPLTRLLKDELAQASDECFRHSDRESL